MNATSQIFTIGAYGKASPECIIISIKYYLYESLSLCISSYKEYNWVICSSDRESSWDDERPSPNVFCWPLASSCDLRVTAYFWKGRFFSIWISCPHANVNFFVPSTPEERSCPPRRSRLCVAETLHEHICMSYRNKHLGQMQLETPV